jgi:hypothetical protein
VRPLPFSTDQFLDVFAAYNTALWHAATALWFVTLGAVIRLIRGRARGTELGALLAIHWAWSGLVYHALYFSTINPLAPVFALLFMIQAAGFAWTGVARPRLMFVWSNSLRHVLAALLLAYALAYPGLALLVHDWPRVPMFGVPCPTTLFTAGCLLAAARPTPRRLFVIPVLWSLVGGSAALLLGITPDLALFAAGAALVAFALAPRALDRPHTW